MEVIGIVLATIAFIFGCYFAVKVLFYTTARLHCYIFNSDGNILGRFLALFPWLPLMAASVILFILAAIAGASLAKEFVQWLNED